MLRSLAGIAVGAALLFSAAPAQGQVAWEGPLLVSPAAPSGWGLYLVDPAPGGGLGVMSTWRRGGLLGYRIGLAEGWRDELAVYGGIDASRRFVEHSDDFPLDVSWVLGGGIGVGEAALLSFPGGLIVGRDVTVNGTWLNPYGGLRVVLDAWMGSDRPGDDLNLGLLLDLGVDISFDPGWAVRFGATAGERSTVAVGFSFRLR